MKNKYQCVCATHESSGERPHSYFVWAESLDAATFSECPVCGSEALTAIPCKKDGEGVAYFGRKNWKPF